MSSNDPNYNPFQSMPQPPKPERRVNPSMRGRPYPRTARLGFFDCYFEAKDFFGNEYWSFWGLIFVGGMLAGAIPIVLLGPIYCGVGLCFKAQEQGQRPSFDIMFKGFDFFMNTLIPVLLYSLLLLVIVPCYIGGFFGGVALMITGDPVGILLGMCVIFAAFLVTTIGASIMGYGMMFSCFLVADYKLEGMEAFNVSLSGMSKNVFGLASNLIASLIVLFVSLLLCYIPFLLMLPLFYGATFMSYRKIFRPEFARKSF